ncbi:MAG: hypothetical protein A2Z88_05125 [Omnitrophica WOR_2 bacterium GWA2_47_8]|nr:MAG: hypothetical protein A2Z88_05125 [Omnitrophica WOR_2 bacterium GWA2_47_8]
MILKFISTLLFSIVFIAHSQAAATPIYEYYIKEGKKFYEQGDIAEAISQFNRALMMDASSQEALTYLQKLGVTIEDIQTYKSPSIEIAKLNQAIKVYKDKMSELQDKNYEQELRCEELEENKRVLCEALKQQGESNSILAIKLGLAQEAKEQRELVDKQRIGQLQEETSEQARRLELNERLSKQEVQLLDKTEDIVDEKQKKIEQLSKDVELVKGQSADAISDYERKIFDQAAYHDNEVMGLKKELIKTKEAHAKDNRLKSEEVSRFKGLLEDTEKELHEKLAMAGSGDAKIREQLKEKDQYIAQLKEKLASVVKKVSFLERHVQSSKPEDVLFLKAQLLDIETDLNKKNDLLEEKDQALSIMQDRLNEAKERLGFVEQIVEEREGQIKELQRELKQRETPEDLK